MLGIITRNSKPSIQRALQNFSSVSPGDFELIISRDDPIEPKPSGDGIILAARRMDVSPDEMVIVGDYILDIQAGKAAGAYTVLLNNPRLPVSAEVECDHRVSHLREVKDIVRLGLSLPGGKLPNDLLEKFLTQFGFEDPSVIIKPGVGEDAAAADISGEEVLVLKTDPITFAAESIGKYAVLVNANDIATSGALPRWFLTTLMFPAGTSALAVREVMKELSATCRKWKITLCGGHTEITDAVTRPVVCGTMAGTVKRGALIDKKNIKTGDRVLMTKGVAVEGTAIIAREFGDRLEELGVSRKDMERSSRFLDFISVLDEARVAARIEGVSAMHDVTEGGLATALAELSIAGNHRIRVTIENIPIFKETIRICGLLKLDPLGLIGSGSLIICCRQYSADLVMAEIRKAGIAVKDIGEVRESGKGVEALQHRRPVPWPTFEVDEIARLF